MTESPMVSGAGSWEGTSGKAKGSYSHYFGHPLYVRESRRIVDGWDAYVDGLQIGTFWSQDEAQREAQRFVDVPRSEIRQIARSQSASKR